MKLFFEQFLKIISLLNNYTLTIILFLTIFMFLLYFFYLILILRNIPKNNDIPIGMSEAEIKSQLLNNLYSDSKSAKNDFEL